MLCVLAGPWNFLAELGVAAGPLIRCTEPCFRPRVNYIRRITGNTLETLASKLCLFLDGLLDSFSPFNAHRFVQWMHQPGIHAFATGRWIPLLENRLLSTFCGNGDWFGGSTSNEGGVP